MKLDHVFIPYGAYWSTPFTRWQGNFAHLHPMLFATDVSRIALRERDIALETFDTLFLGMTIPAEHSFYGAPWLAGLIGATTISGPTISQARATSARVVGNAAYEVETDTDRCILAITCDKTSNGPHIYYPNPSGSGGKGESEDWVWDNFNFDPFATNAMIETAENVARESHITWEEQNEVTLLRYQQYQEALQEDAAFYRRYMVSPIEVKDPSGRKVIATVADDEGIYATTEEGLSRLRPVKEGGTVSFGSQTHPADGNCGMVLTSKERAQELSRDSAVTVQIISFGHPQGPTGMRLIIELIEELVLRGGGYGLFTGCAAGDTGAAIVLYVDVT